MQTVKVLDANLRDHVYWWCQLAQVLLLMLNCTNKAQPARKSRTDGSLLYNSSRSVLICRLSPSLHSCSEKKGSTDELVTLKPDQMLSGRCLYTVRTLVDNSPVVFIWQEFSQSIEDCLFSLGNTLPSLCQSIDRSALESSNNCFQTMEIVQIVKFLGMWRGGEGRGGEGREIQRRGGGWGGRVAKLL